MDEADFDRAARRAAIAVRNEAELIAEPEVAFADLLAEVASDSSTTVRLDRELRRRRRWVPISAAATVIVAIAGIALVAGREQSGVPATEVPFDPSVTPSTTPATSVSTVESTATIVEPVAPTATEPDGTMAPQSQPVGGSQVIVADDLGDPVDRTVLASYGAGDGAEELGFEDCQECEPTAPGVPIITESGDIIVADLHNRRWQIIREGEWQSLPFPDGQRLVVSPIQATDGYIYAVVDQGGSVAVVALDPTELVPAATYPLSRSLGIATMRQRNDEVLYGDTLITTVQHRPDLPSWHYEWQTNHLQLGIADIVQEFSLPTAWSVNVDSISRLDDGSVVLHALATDSSGDDWIIARFWVDGSYASGIIPNAPVTSDVYGRFTPNGWVQLDDAISLYALPVFASPDPLAAWTVPDIAPVALDAVPRLLPSDLIDDTPTLVRSEDTGTTGRDPYHFQAWARTEVDGTVSGLVVINTGFEASLVNSTSERVTVPGWPIARSGLMASDDLVSIDLHTAERSVHVWSQGIAEDEIVRLAGALSVDVDGSGWTTPSFSRTETWVLVNEGWESAFALRSLRGATPDGITLEILIARGMPSTALTPLATGESIRLVHVDDRPALLFDRGGVVGLTYSPTDDVVVVLGADSTIDELIDVARSLIQVDQATWESQTVVDTSQDDGCNSFFC